MDHHIGRHWPNTYRAEAAGNAEHPTIESECPCPREPCGLVSQAKAHPDCKHHTLNAAKTIRTSHTEEDCPGARA